MKHILVSIAALVATACADDSPAMFLPSEQNASNPAFVKWQAQKAARADYTAKYNRFWELYHAQDEKPLTQDELVEFGGLGVWLAGNMTR